MIQKSRYLSYLLRLWREGSDHLPLWRASLESPEAGERLGFASLADLFAFLESEIESSPAGLECSDGERRWPSERP